MRIVALIIACLCLSIGCQQNAKPVTGGTTGTLVAGGIPLQEFEVKVYEPGGSTPLGVGVTGPDGKFQLVQVQANKSLELPPGEYCFTIDSVGPAAPRLPTTYSNPSKSPIKTKWKPEDNSLDLKIPALK